jgi:hypothetical protein
MLLGIIHLIHCPILVIYPYISDTYDRAYLIYFMLIVFSYIVLKNECLISYIGKRRIDNSYRAGQKMNYYPEMYIFTKNDQQIKLYFTTMTLLYVYSIFIVFVRYSKIIGKLEHVPF